MPADLDRTRLLVYELRVLLVRMRNAEDPFAPMLEHMTARFLAEVDADRPDEAERIVGPVLAALPAAEL